MHTPKRLLLTSALSAACAAAQVALAQQAPAPASAPTQDQTVVLSPFDVTAAADNGYWVSNSTSGTMLNTPIKDLPMPIEVISSQFITDTGATDLREALRYSSSIQLVDWNTMGQAIGSFDTTPGKLNNPEGDTASAAQTTVKFRGFETTSVLRDGFARGNATDEVNIDRIELVGGPSSLLYGVSNFGGVVNYFVKQPGDAFAADYDLTYGSYDFERATFDITGPIAKGLDYRLTGAWQSQGSWTDFNTERHFFISPIVTYRPFSETKITLDFEYGRQRRDGIGWQDLRAAPGYVNDDANVEYGFLQINGLSPRTFRWSGPDTYNDSESNNLEFKIEQQLAPGLNLWAGFDQSVFNYSQLDNMAAVQAASNFTSGYLPLASDIATITYVPLAADESIDTTPTPSTITYQWEKKLDDTTIDQARVNLAYDLKLFSNGASSLLAIDNSFLAGVSYQQNVETYHTWQTPGNTQNYHSPADTSAIVFGHQADGRPDQAMVEYDNYKHTTPDMAGYAVYEGKFLGDRLTVVAGVRSDRSHTTDWTYDPEFQYGGGQNNSGPPTLSRSSDSSNRTVQWGVSYAVTPELSVFGMDSEGVEPNYDGYIDPYGNPVKAALARDSEVGIKFDIAHERISGTVSYFTINRTDTPIGSANYYWWAPSMIGGKLHWNPSSDVIFSLGGNSNPATGVYSPNAASLFGSSQLAGLWNAGVSSGAIYLATNSAGQQNYYVDASKAAGAAWMNAFFGAANQAAALDNGNGYYGWFWNEDNLTNNAGSDEYGYATNSNNDVILGSDRSSGFDGSLLLRPVDNLQIVLSWTYTKRVVVNGGQWIQYPSTPDQWEIWDVMWYNWMAGGHGQPLSSVYATPGNTSSWIAPTTNQRDDDTPRNQGAVWVAYDLPKTSPAKGLTLGAGANYTGPRQWETGVTSGITDANGNPINLETTSMLTVNGMVRYSFPLAGRPSSLQFNVDNVANERRQTVPGAWMDPRTWTLSFAMRY